MAERVIRRLDGRLPVVVGVTAPGLAPMRELADSVMDMGAAGVLVAPPWTLRTDDQIFAFYAVGGRRARGDALRAPGLSADHQRHDRAQGDRAHRPRGADLRDAQARGLAGPRQDQRAARVERPRRHPAHLDPLRQRRPVPARGDEPRRRRRDDRLLLSRDDGRRRARASASATSSAPTTSSTPTCRWRATSSSRGSASPAASTCSPSAA